MKKHLVYLLPAIIVLANFLNPLLVHAQTDTTSVKKTEIYTYVDKMPEYPGGEKALMQFIGSNITYSRNQPEGTMLFSFVVDKKGSITDIQVKESIDAALEQECIRVIKATDGKWKPGKQGGKRVDVRYTLPLRFIQPETQDAPQQNTQAVSESMPEYTDGAMGLMVFLSKNIKYPKGAKKKGMVIISFVVNETGNLSDYKVESSLEPLLDEEAIRVLKLTDGKWVPGKQNEQPVKVRFKVPVLIKG